MRLTKNKRLVAKGIAFLIIFFQALTSYAQEPINLAHIKQSLIKYHDSGEYEKDITHVTENAIQYLKRTHTSAKRPAIVIDIDETALSNFHTMQELSFGGSLKEIQKKETKAEDPPIKPILKLYHFAKSHRIATFFISGRPEHEWHATVRNLRKAGYTTWDGLMLKPSRYEKKSAAIFKTAMRKKLIAQGYNILINIGDQSSDLVGGYAKKTYKIPNPFYLIN